MKLTRPREIEAALDRPAPDIRLYLLHGPDAATAAELAARLARAMGTDAERIDLDGAGLKSDPARLADEAASLSLFGGVRHIRVTAVGEESLEALELLLAADRAGNPVVAIAPSVRSTAKVVKLATDARHAIAFACYEPSAADAEKIAIAIAREHGLRPIGDVARRVATAAAGDRAVIAREIEKLALYLDAAPERPHDLDQGDLDAVGADLGDAEMTRLVAAVVEGRPNALGEELGRLDQAGTSAIPWLRQLARRLLSLAEMRADIDRGDPVDAVMKRHRVFFREEQATAALLRRWPAAMLTRALDQVRSVERAIMASGNAGGVLAAQAVMTIARGMERRG